MRIIFDIEVASLLKNTKEVTKAKMSRTTEAQKKEVAPEELFPKDPEFQGYYIQVRDELRIIVREQESTVLKTNHAIGAKIVEASTYLHTKYEVTDSKGHNGKVGEMMDRLAIDLDRGHSTLYDCKTFAEKYTNWDAFATKKFTVQRMNSSALESPVELEVLGKDMSWREVVKYVVREQQGEDSGDESESSASETHTITVSSPKQVFVIPLPVDTLEKFRQIALQRKELPDQILANGIRKYIERYGK